MKKIKIGTIIIFIVLLFIPILKFNWKENVVSEIDNRTLTNNPLGPNYQPENDDDDLTDALDNYLQDRIGFRDQMIYLYTVANDKLFDKMVHPTYTYGKDGYVFFNAERQPEFNEYHATFIDMIEKIQDYCEARNVPFLFVFEPAKISVLQDELQEGINYNNDWVQDFMKELDRRDINYVDNTSLLKEKMEEGENVFNKKYNAGHWNDLGAFYGVNNVLDALKAWYPTIHINQKDEFDITERLNTSLMVSEFPIHEYEPVFTPKAKVDDITDRYAKDIVLNEQFPHFQYVINEKRKEEGAPKALVFQGSYMNEMGYKFLENSLGEYIAVHDYQNVINFDYYYNIFQPDCVIFEVAEYTVNEDYFSQENMEKMVLNPKEEGLEENSEVISEELNKSDFTAEKNGSLYNIEVQNLDKDAEYVYMETNDNIYDLKKDENGRKYSVTINARDYDENNIEFITYKSGVIKKYSLN